MCTRKMAHVKGDLCTRKMASVKGDPPLKRRGSYGLIPPRLSELRLVLLGNCWSLKASVGNLLLEKSEFTQHNKNDKCVKVSGTFQDKPVTVIYTPDQLLSSTSQQQQQQFIQDIKALSAPGPHVFLLVLQPEDFTEKHKSRLQSVLESLREQDFHHSLVLMSRPRILTPGSIEKYMRKPHIKDLIKRCRYRYLGMDHTDLSDLEVKEFRRKELFSRIGDLLKEKDGAHLSPDSSEEEDTGLTLASGIKHKPSLNLVVFGSSGAGKTSAAESILGRAELPAASSPGQCVKHEAEVCGRRVSLVELPALSGEPLETVMEQCLRCISLCAPEGVHAFILVLPLGPLTDEDKTELKTIQDTLSSRVLRFTMILFTVDSESTAPHELQFIKGHRDIQELCQSCGGGDLIFNLRDQQKVSELLESVETLRAKNEPHSFTTETLQQVQIEKICALQKGLQDTKPTGPDRSDQSPGRLRIALIGKTGTGKSSSGNTILGRDEFETRPSQRSVTTVCQRAEAEIDGRRVCVVDTPGLFDCSLSHDEERLRCVSLLAPGPHVFLLVIRFGRLTQEEEKTLELIKKGFGKEAQRHTIILFTYGDSLTESIENFIKYDCDDSFKEFISECGNRFHVFNNREKKDHTQVKALMKKMEDMMKENGGECYTNDMLLKAEMDIKKDIKRIMEEGEEKIRRERDALEKDSLYHKTKIDTLTEKNSQLQKRYDQEKIKNKTLEEELCVFKRSIKEDIEGIIDLQQKFEEQRKDITKK